MRVKWLAILLWIGWGCQQPSQPSTASKNNQADVREALLLTDFKSLEALKTELDIEYRTGRWPEVRLTHTSSGRTIESILATGIHETHFIKARVGSLWDRMMLGVQSPYAVANRRDMLKILYLGRRRHALFRAGDAAFYDLAEMMVDHISYEDIASVRSEDLSEKGYLNTFNHITAQAFITSLFSEKMADFIADLHERYRLPELSTGVFTEEQLNDIENGPVDNYIDIVNNEWGQELGKQLKEKYQINRNTDWTEELLANYLNDIQSYFSWAFQIGFEPFRPTDEVVKRYIHKLRIVMGEEFEQYF